MRKAQAAMEFLMTYGWAILVVLAAIGALAYFGVLSPDRFLPEKCTLPSGTACLDFNYAAGTGIAMRIQNSAGFDMTGVSVTVNGTGCNVVASGQATLTDGEQQTYTASCAPSSGKFKGAIAMAYTNSQTSMAHSKLGEVILKIP
ncbi:MAG: hypothetical protein ABIF10_05925 [Candidatus Woesearchaeota archaeon]